MSLNLEIKLQRAAQKEKAYVKPEKEVIIFKSAAEEQRWRLGKMMERPVRIFYF